MSINFLFFGAHVLSPRNWCTRIVTHRRTSQAPFQAQKNTDYFFFFFAYILGTKNNLKRDAKLLSVRILLSKQ